MDENHQVNVNGNNQSKKKLLDNFPNPIYKRPFLIEKIQKDIYRGKNYFKFIKTKSSDTKLLKLKNNIRKKVKIKKMNPLAQNFLASNNFAYFYEFFGKLNNNLRIKSIKKNMFIIPSERIIQRQKSNFSLPAISNRKTIKIPMMKKNNKTFLSVENNDIIEKEKEKNKDNKDTNNTIIKSEIIETKDIYNEPRIIKIRSFSNICKNNDTSINNENKLYDINEINNKYNLQLNLAIKKEKKNTIFSGKRYTIAGMLNKLFQYYSSESNANNNTINSSMENQTSNLLNYTKLNNINKFIPFKNISEINNEESNTFLTKLNVTNNAQINDKEKEKENKFSITKFINERCSLNVINRKNKEIIDKNEKIKIDCLLSKLESDISIKKIIYRYLGKTIYEISKDQSYVRLKELEKKIIDILKRENNSG